MLIEEATTSPLQTQGLDKKLAVGSLALQPGGNVWTQVSHIDKNVNRGSMDVLPLPHRYHQAPARAAGKEEQQRTRVPQKKQQLVVFVLLAVFLVQLLHHETLDVSVSWEPSHS